MFAKTWNNPQDFQFKRPPGPIMQILGLYLESIFGWVAALPRYKFTDVCKELLRGATGALLTDICMYEKINL